MSGEGVQGEFRKLIIGSPSMFRGASDILKGNSSGLKTWQRRRKGRSSVGRREMLLPASHGVNEIDSDF